LLEENFDKVYEEFEEANEKYQEYLYEYKL
jgi:hypothetical protein